MSWLADSWTYVSTSLSTNEIPSVSGEGVMINLSQLSLQLLIDSAQIDKRSGFTAVTLDAVETDGLRVKISDRWARSQKQ